MGMRSPYHRWQQYGFQSLVRREPSHSRDALHHGMRSSTSNSGTLFVKEVENRLFWQTGIFLFCVFLRSFLFSQNFFQENFQNCIWNHPCGFLLVERNESTEVLRLAKFTKSSKTILAKWPLSNSIDERALPCNHELWQFHSRLQVNMPFRGSTAMTRAYQGKHKRRSKSGRNSLRSDRHWI